jgi:hypothetical protein
LRVVARRFLLPGSFLLATAGLAILVSGGFVASIFGVRVSARSPAPALIGAIALLIAWIVVARRAQLLSADLVAAHRWLTHRATAVVMVIAILAAAAATSFHSFSAAGSDASGYLSQTAMLQQGDLVYREPLAAIADWPDAAATLAPLGWRAGPEAGTQVPTYAVGLPLLLLPLHALGGAVAASLVVPACLAFAIWATASLAFRLAGAYASLIAAVWIATSPVALVESMQIMSDVPAAAAWIACWYFAVREKSAAAGVAAAVAVLIRPNLAPLAAIPGFYLWRAGLAPFALPVACAGIVVAYLQWRWFGSPLRSGYGTAEEIYSLANVAPNSALYLRWLVETHGPWLLIAPLALVWPKIRAMRWLLPFAALVIAAYLIYAVFEVWTYLRFLLPGLALAMIAVSAVIAAALAVLPKGPHPIGLAVIVLALAAANVASAREHGVFLAGARLSRARVVGERVAQLLPANAVIVSGEQSGSMRYYTGRSIVRWDVAASDVLDAAIARIHTAGYVVWVVLDDWEEEPFRRKFPGVAAAALDQPPAVESAPGLGIRTRAWPLR